MKSLLSSLVALIVVAVLPGAAFSGVWHSDAGEALSGSRSFGSGISGTANTPPTSALAWNISQENGIWTYVYTFSGLNKNLSHVLFEVSEDYEKAETFSPGSRGNSNPALPNSLYAIKLSASSGQTTFTIVTDHAPVWGSFYTKAGNVDTSNGWAIWNTGLNFSDYRTNAALTQADFIVRPNGSPVPIPGPILLLGSGILGLFSTRGKRTS